MGDAAPEPQKRASVEDIDVDVGVGETQVTAGYVFQEELWLDNEAKEIRNAELWQNLRERKKYANKVFCLVSCCLGGVFVLALLQGIHLPQVMWWFYFELNEAVMIALITGATANVIGLFAIVMVNLFPKRQPPDLDN